VAGQNRARAWGTQKVNNNKPSAQNKRREGDALLSELATLAHNNQLLWSRGGRSLGHRR